MTEVAAPELRVWASLCEDVRQELREPPWGSVIRGPEPPTEGAPVLADATLAIDLGRAVSWLRRLVVSAAAAGGPAATIRPGRLSRERALDLLAAAVAEHEVDELARELDAEPGALAAVACLGAMPLLHAARRAVERSVPATWAHGYCPVCGAWPTLAEERGVERRRHFRCARCGGGWFAGWLRCPYCDSNDHRQAAALVPDDAGARHRVDACEACRGYVKTLTVLLPTEPADIALADLHTLELDLGALARGYHRPPPARRAASTRIVAGPVPS